MNHGQDTEFYDNATVAVRATGTPALKAIAKHDALRPQSHSFHCRRNLLFRLALVSLGVDVVEHSAGTVHIFVQPLFDLLGLFTQKAAG